MRTQSLFIALAALAAPTLAGISQGFSYGATNPDGSCRKYDDFKRLFERAKNLPGASNFTAARLYTSIQCGTSADYIEAYKAAIDTDTTILVGLWASGGRQVFENELHALLGAAQALKDDFTKRLVGISVGSEDLYRSSPQGVINGEGPGSTAEEIEGYIGWLRDWIKGTDLEHIPVTHVDTWYVVFMLRTPLIGTIRARRWPTLKILEPFRDRVLANTAIVAGLPGCYLKLAEWFGPSTSYATTRFHTSKIRDPTRSRKRRKISGRQCQPLRA